MYLPHPERWRLVKKKKKKYELALKMKFYDNLVLLVCLQLAERFTSPPKFHTSLHVLSGEIASFAIVSTIFKYSFVKGGALHSEITRKEGELWTASYHNSSYSFATTIDKHTLICVSKTVSWPATNSIQIIPDTLRYGLFPWNY